MHKRVFLSAPFFWNRGRPVKGVAMPPSIPLNDDVPEMVVCSIKDRSGRRKND
jgi:hypothetical protein